MFRFQFGFGLKVVLYSCSSVSYDGNSLIAPFDGGWGDMFGSINVVFDNSRFGLDVFPVVNDILGNGSSGFCPDLLRMFTVEGIMSCFVGNVGRQGLHAVDFHHGDVLRWFFGEFR